MQEAHYVHVDSAGEFLEVPDVRNEKGVSDAEQNVQAVLCGDDGVSRHSRHRVFARTRGAAKTTASGSPLAAPRYARHFFSFLRNRPKTVYYYEA